MIVQSTPVLTADRMRALAGVEHVHHLLLRQWHAGAGCTRICADRKDTRTGAALPGLVCDLALTLLLGRCSTQLGQLHDHERVCAIAHCAITLESMTGLQ